MKSVNEYCSRPVIPMMIVTGRLTPAIMKTEICLTKLDLFLIDVIQIDEEKRNNVKWAPRMARGIRIYPAN